MAKRRSRSINNYRAIVGAGCLTAGIVLVILNFNPMFLIALLLVAAGLSLLLPLIG